MNELSLFTGAGGGILGSKLLGWRTVGYVEIDDYCQKIIKQRIADGILDNAPTFGDIKTFINQGYAESYKGMVGVLTGGDPCQDNSAAAPHGSPKPSLGGEFIEVVRIVNPRYVLRENPAVVRKNAPWPADKFIEELELMGYAAIPVDIGACCVGYDHRRKRRFVFAEKISAYSQNQPRLQATEIAVSIGGRRETWETTDRGAWRKESSIPGILSEPDVHREINGVAHRVDRLKAIGNGQVPAVVKAAWELLTS